MLKSDKKFIQAYTLIEAMITIFIAAIIVAFGTPSYVESAANKRLVSSAGEISYSISAARQEAVARLEAVSVCPSDDGSTCKKVPWQNGWIVFVDVNENLVVDAGEEILFKNEALHSRIVVNTSEDFEEGFTIRQNGRLDIYNTQHIVICDDRGATDWSRSVVVTFLATNHIFSLKDAGLTSCTGAT